MCVCGCVDRVGSVLGLLINPWARAVLLSQTDRLSPGPAPVMRAHTNKPLQRDRASRNVRFRTRGSERKRAREREGEAEGGKGLCTSMRLCVAQFEHRERVGGGCLTFGQQQDFDPI